MITAIDTETTLAGNREPIPRLVCISIANDLGVEVIAADDPRLFAIVVGILSGGAVLANAPFDLFVLWRALGPELWPHIRAALEAGRIFDVLTREKLIDIAAGMHRKRGPYNLGAVAARRAGLALDKSDPWRRRYGSFIRQPARRSAWPTHDYVYNVHDDGWWSCSRCDVSAPGDAYEDAMCPPCYRTGGDTFEIVPLRDWPIAAISYAQLDAWATWRVYQEQERIRWVNVFGQRRDVFVDAPAQARAHLALYAMTLRGVHTDRARVDALDALLSARIAGLEARALRDGLAAVSGDHKTARVCDDRRRGARCSHGRTKRTKAAAQAALVEWCRATGKTPMRNALTDKAAARGEREGSIALSKKALEYAGVPRGKWVGAELRDKADPEGKTAHPLEVYRELGGLRASYSKNIPVLKHSIIRTRYDELVSSGRTSASGFKQIKIEDADDEDEEGLEDFDCELEPGDEFVGTNTQNWPRSGGWRECLVPPP